METAPTRREWAMRRQMMTPSAISRAVSAGAWGIALVTATAACQPAAAQPAESLAGIVAPSLEKRQLAGAV
ncbi:MAG: hypothetical protein ACKOCN_09030, partial [Planctomycetaceae bacterium]